MIDVCMYEKPGESLIRLKDVCAGGIFCNEDRVPQADYESEPNFAKDQEGNHDNEKLRSPPDNDM